MKTRMRFFSLTLCLCLLCSLVFCSAVNVSAASVTELTDDGWVKYITIQNIRYSYSITPTEGSSVTSVVKSVPDIKLPWQKIVRENTSIDDVWMTLELNNYDAETLETSLVTVQPGQSAVIAANYKLSLGIHTSNTFTPIDFNLYECRLYLDNDFERYISAELTAWGDGVQLYYTIQNNTDKVIDLSRVTFGMWDSEYTDVYAFQWYITGVQYRVFTDSQQAAQAVADSINQQTEELKDSIEQQTKEHRNMFERLGDRISGFFDNLLTGIIDGLKSLFIPESAYFTEYFEAWDTWMTDHFGALYYPFDLILDILNRFLNLDVPDNPTITFPAIVVRDQVLTEAVEVDLFSAFMGDGYLLYYLYDFYEMYKIVVTVIFVFGLANLARKKLTSIMGGGE